MCEKLAFFDFFESFVPPRNLRLLLHDAVIVGGTLNQAERLLEVEVECGETIPEAARTALQQLLTEQYQLRQLRLNIRSAKADKGGSGSADLLMGKEIRGKPISMEGLNPKMGSVILEGKVFAAECYETRRPGVWCLTFDMTDYKNSVTVRKYMQAKESESVRNAIAPGMWLRS